MGCLNSCSHVLANVLLKILQISEGVNFEFFIKLIMLQIVLLQQGRFLSSFSAFQISLKNFCDVFFYSYFYFESRKWQLNDSNFYQMSWYEKLNFLNDLQIDFNILNLKMWYLLGFFTKFFFTLMFKIRILVLVSEIMRGCFSGRKKVKDVYLL